MSKWVDYKGIGRKNIKVASASREKRVYAEQSMQEDPAVTLEKWRAYMLQYFSEAEIELFSQVRCAMEFHSYQASIRKPPRSQPAGGSSAPTCPPGQGQTHTTR